MDQFDKKFTSLLEEELDLEQITVSEELIAKTLEKVKNTNEFNKEFDKITSYHLPKKENYIKRLSMVAVFLLLFFGIDFFIDMNFKTSSNDNMEMNQNSNIENKVNSLQNNNDYHLDSGDMYNYSTAQGQENGENSSEIALDTEETASEEAIKDAPIENLTENPVLTSGIASIEIILRETIENEEVKYMTILELIEKEVIIHESENDSRTTQDSKKSNQLFDINIDQDSILWKLKIVYFTADGEKNILINDTNCYIINELEEIEVVYYTENTLKLQEEILSIVQ